MVSGVLPSIRRTGSYSTAELSRMDILKLAMQAEEEKLKLQASLGWLRIAGYTNALMEKAGLDIKISYYGATGAKGEDGESADPLSKCV